MVDNETAKLIGGPLSGKTVDLVGEYYVRCIIIRRVYAVYYWAYGDKSKGEIVGKFAGYFRDSGGKKKAHLSKEEKEEIDGCIEGMRKMELLRSGAKIRYTT